MIGSESSSVSSRPLDFGGISNLGERTIDSAIYTCTQHCCLLSFGGEFGIFGGAFPPPPPSRLDETLRVKNRTDAAQHQTAPKQHSTKLHRTNKAQHKHSTTQIKRDLLCSVVCLVQDWREMAYFISAETRVRTRVVWVRITWLYHYTTPVQLFAAYLIHPLCTSLSLRPSSRPPTHPPCPCLPPPPSSSALLIQSNIIRRMYPEGMFLVFHIGGETMSIIATLKTNSAFNTHRTRCI